jgi:hypothetical protein
MIIGIKIGGLRITDCGLRIADCGLRIADCGLRIADCGLRMQFIPMKAGDGGSVNNLLFKDYTQLTSNNPPIR